MPPVGKHANFNQLCELQRCLVIEMREDRISFQEIGNRIG